MKYFVRKPGTNDFSGPSTFEEIVSQLKAGTIAADYEVLESAGQTFGALKQATDWKRIDQRWASAELASAIAAAPAPQTSGEFPLQATAPTRAKSGAWILFLAGVGSVPIWILAFGGHHSTVAARQVQSVLCFLSLLASVAAPFLSGLTLGKKFGLALLALCAFFLSTALSMVLWLAIHGLPIG